MHHVLLWCVCLCVGVCTVFSSQAGGRPLTFVSIIDWVLPPANDTPGGVQPRPPPHLETFKLVSPRQHTTTLCCIKTKNTTFSNVIMLVYVSLTLVHGHLSVRGEEGIIFVSVSLCGVVMPQIDLIWAFLVFVCLFLGHHGRECGWSEDCHNTPLFWLLA